MGLFVGLMSGTSMDAVDAALVEFGDHTAHLRGSSCLQWPPALRSRLQAVASDAPLSATDFAILDAEVGAFFAHAVEQLLAASGAASVQVSAIGCHGQTIAHAPDATPPTTWQLGDANIIAERSGITTINDFRRRDMAAGGQGAPLAPAFHAAMLRDPVEPRVVLNLGGIANLTVLPGDAMQPVIGFDSGPASCLMDLWIRQQQGHPFDANGDWATSAAPDPGLLASLLDDPYFSRAAPKSTGTQYFSASWLQDRLARHAPLPAARVQATLLAFTAQTVCDALQRWAPGTQRVLVCGGGVHNGALIERLRSQLQLPVASTAGYGIAPDWMEAMAFAWLAQQTLAARPGNLPAVTGAAGARILGAIHPA